MYSETCMSQRMDRRNISYRPLHDVQARIPDAAEILIPPTTAMQFGYAKDRDHVTWMYDHTRISKPTHRKRQQTADFLQHAHIHISMQIHCVASETRVSQRTHSDNIPHRPFGDRGMMPISDAGEFPLSVVQFW
jgi:hypothetical protein